MLERDRVIKVIVGRRVGLEPQQHDELVCLHVTHERGILVSDPLAVPALVTLLLLLGVAGDWANARAHRAVGPQRHVACGSHRQVSEQRPKKSPEHERCKGASRKCCPLSFPGMLCTNNATIYRTIDSHLALTACFPT